MKLTLKTIATLLTIVGFTSIVSAQEHVKTDNVKTLPSVDLKTLDGKVINSNDFDNDGKPIIIDFWATWCKPCVSELNAIQEVYSEWQEETGVKIIAISIDDARTMATVAPFVNGKNWDYEVYLDVNSDFKRAMNVNMVPQTFVLNGKKEIIYHHSSYIPGNEDELFKEVQKIVADAKAKPE